MCVLQEFEILKSLSHENIIKVFCTYSTESYVFIFMEYIKEELLSKLLEKEYFSEQETKQIMKQLLSVADYLHSQGLVHRDMKLENILIKEQTDGYLVKVIDFGQAVSFEEGQTLTKVCGSLFYLPPEVMMRSYNHKCDIWSLGVICYSLLTGHFPFDSDFDEEIYEKIAMSRLTFTKFDQKHVSKQAMRFVKRLICRKVHKRLEAS